MNRPSLWAAAVVAIACSAVVASGPIIPDQSEIVRRMRDADAARQQSFPGYVATRFYTVENARLHVKATMKAEVIVDVSGQKTFRILESAGPGTIRKMVFQRMLE